MKTQNLKKNSRKLRNLMLLTSLCAILSCSSNDRTFIADSTPTDPKDPSIIIPVPNKPTDPSKPIDPSKPDPEKPPVVDASSRFTTTPDITKLKEGIYDSPKYEQKNSNNSNLGVTTIIDSMKYGFDVYGSMLVLPSTKMIVKKDGAAFWKDVHSSVINKNFIKNLTTSYLKDIDNLTLTMEEGSYLFMFQDAVINLSDSNFSNILSEIPTLKSRINGTGYNEIKFADTQLNIDEDIDLDNDNNKYFKAVSDIKPVRIVLSAGKNLTGKNDGLVAIKSQDTIDNKGTIKLTGKNTIALFSKKHTDNYENASIEVGEDSIGQYVIYDVEYNGYRRNQNDGTITLGKKSTGMRIDRNFNNISGAAFNADKGKILSTAEKAIGIMAYTTDAVHPTGDTSNFEIKNHGEINLSGDRSTGMYTAGKGKMEMYNDKKIIMGDSSDKNNPSIAMLSTNPKSEGYNHFDGIIEIGKNSIGMAGVNGGELYNYGTIIIKGEGGVGMYLADGTEGVNTGTIETDGTGLKNVIGVIVGKNSKFTNLSTGVININSENGKGVVFENGAIIENNGEIKVNGANTDPEQVTEKPTTVKPLSDKVTPKAISVKSDLGIYVNSLGKTNPINGLANLGLNSADLLIGAEATEKTNATEVTVGSNVLDPFNDSIKTSNIADWTVKSGSLIWEADPEIKDNRIEKVTLKKQSYAKFADENTEGVAKALDEKYVVANEKDKQIFNYMNTLRSAESLGGVYREIRGSQYINVQQRINQTDNLLDKQISSLQKENADKAGHHIETFFNKDKHSFKTDEVPDTTSTAYGVSYLFNNTDNNWGLYGGIAINRYKFKDIAHSKENITMFKAGGYKKFDLNNFDWTLSGDVFISQNDMKRRVMVGNNIYEHKADYNAYGFSVKNEISKTYQLTEDSTIKPYGALKLGYGSFNRIKEKDGTLGMDVKGNSYYSVKPSAGVEVAYTKKITDNTKFKASLDLAYEHELGNANRKENEIKFMNTNTTYKLKGAKSENRGNFRSGVKVGMETGRFNFSVNGGYDTQDKNAHIGVGFGASF